MTFVVIMARVCARHVKWCIAAQLALTLPACLVDKGRCGPNQESNVAGNCVCRLGFVPDEGLICRPCGENEISRGNNCTCKDGFVRDGAQRCTQQAAGVGDPCAGMENCPASAPHCQAQADGTSYCTTTGCTADAQCPGGYSCAAMATPSVCLRPPSGQGMACSKQEDCAGKEASYCETTSGKVCLVANCKEDSDCFSGWGCCDLSAFGLPTLCITEGSCPVP